MYGEFRSRRSFSPVKEGDELDVKIEAVGAKGDGIAKKDGFVLFVPNTKEGDEVRVRVSRVLRRVGFADVVGEGISSTEAEEEAEAEEPTEEEKKEETEEAVEEEKNEETPEDSEDFGEDLEEEKKKK